MSFERPAPSAAKEKKTPVVTIEDSDPISTLAHAYRREREAAGQRIDHADIYRKAIEAYEELSAAVDPHKPYYEHRLLSDLPNPDDRALAINTMVKSYREGLGVNLPKDLIESRYSEMLRTMSGVSRTALAGFYEATGVKPSEQLLASFFEKRFDSAMRIDDDHAFEAGWIFDDVKTVSKLFGVEPAPTLVQNVINDLRFTGSGKYSSLILLIKTFELPIEAEATTNIIEHLLITGRTDIAQKWCEQFKQDYAKFTEQYAKKLLESNNLKGAHDLQTKAGITIRVEDLRASMARIGSIDWAGAIVRLFGRVLDQPAFEELLLKDFNLKAFAHLFEQAGFQTLSGDAVRKIADLRSRSQRIDQILVFEPSARSALARIWPKDVEMFPWHDAASKLDALQAHADRKEHDPWETDLRPLLESRVGFPMHNIKLSRPEDGQLVVDFVKEFGMNDLPHLFALFLRIRRYKGDNEALAMINYDLKDIGLTFDEKSPQKTIQEIKKYVHELQQKLLRDEDVNISGPIIPELVQSLVGRSQWDRNLLMYDLQKKLNTTKDRSRETFQLPDGYVPGSFDVPMQKKVERDESVVERERQVVLKNPELVSRIDELSDAYLLGFEIKDLSSWWQQTKQRMLAELKTSIQEMSSAVDGEANPKKKIGLQRKAEMLQKKADLITAIDVASGESPDDKTLTAFINALPEALADVPGGKRILQVVTAFHSARLMGEARLKRIVSAVEARSKDGVSAFDTRVFSELLVDYINEHYLHPEQEVSHTGHEPFSKTTAKALATAWGLKPDVKKNPIVIAQQRLETIEQHGSATGDKSMKVSLYPVQGFMRLYAGNVGDACYTSKAEEMAAGKYPNLHAFIFVTGEAAGSTKLQGSVLAVETQTPGGERVLLVRANNPKQRLLMQVDGEQLTLRVLEEMRALAKRRGINRIVAPLDRASESSSNRPQVTAVYHKYFAKREKIQLESSDETNFNGYDNWDSTGFYPVVDITES